MAIATLYQSPQVTNKILGFKASVTNIVLILPLCMCRITLIKFCKETGVAFQRKVIHALLVLSVQRNKMETLNNPKDFV